MLVQDVDLLRDAFRSMRTERPLTIDAIVILSEHLHTIWILQEGDADYPALSGKRLCPDALF